MTENQEVKGKTISREFEGIGKFTVRGITGGERTRIQSDSLKVNSRTGEMELDASELMVNELKTCIIESPEGSNPPKNYIEGLPSGVWEDLSKDIKNLSTVKSTIVKK